MEIVDTQRKNTGAYRLISLFCSKTSARQMVPGSIKIREPVVVTDEKNKYSPHELSKFDWFTIIALPVGANDWLNA